MKKLLIIIFISLTYTTTMAQDTEVRSEQYFAMIYTTGENWDTEKQYHEQAYFSEHSAFMSTLRKGAELSWAVGLRIGFFGAKS